MVRSLFTNGHKLRERIKIIVTKKNNLGESQYKPILYAMHFIIILVILVSRRRKVFPEVVSPYKDLQFRNLESILNAHHILNSFRKEYIYMTD